MAYSIVLDRFQGPLDVLLSLIHERKLEISDVSLSLIAEQYVTYITSHDIPPGETAEFLSIAVQLLLLKTKALLPYLSNESDDETVDLTRQLKIYEAYWLAAKDLDKLARGNAFLFVKTKSHLLEDIGFSPPQRQKISSTMLYDAMNDVLEKLEPIIAFSKSSIKKTVSIAKKISILREILKKAAHTSFHHFLFGRNTNKTEIIVSFLAVLELIKQNEVRLQFNNDKTITLLKGDNVV